MEIRLYSHSKKENSTSRPSGNGTPFQCIIKKESGVVNPIIELDVGLNSSPSNYNYAYIPSFNRYYWIEEWTNSHPLWSASLKCDVLASYKEAIGNSNLYALRSSHTYDGAIIDGLYPTKTISTSNVSTGATLLNNDIQNGLFVLGVVDKNARYGSISYYGLSYYALSLLVDELLDDNMLENSGFDPNDCSLALQKSLIDPLSYIKSCVFIPYPYDSYNVPQTAGMTIWDWDIAIPVKKVGYPPIISREASFTLPKHPQANDRGVYCNSYPYTTLTVAFNPFGEFNLDTLYLANKTSISLRLLIDITNGVGTLDIKNGTYLLERRSARVGVDISLSQVTKDYLGAVNSAVQGTVGAIGSAISGNVGGAIASATSGIINGVQAMQPRQYTVGGGSGSFTNYFFDLELIATFYPIVDDDNASHGRPLCKVIQPKDYPGYLLIQDADISISCTSTELADIRAYLEGGFYYE